MLFGLSTANGAQQVLTASATGPRYTSPSGYFRAYAINFTNNGFAAGAEGAEVPVIPPTAAGFVGVSSGYVSLVQQATTGSIGGGALTAGNCATGTVTLGTAATGHPGIAAASDGTVQGNYVLNVSVSSTTATVSVCAIAAGTPTSKTYNITVF